MMLIVGELCFKLDGEGIQMIVLIDDERSFRDGNIDCIVMRNSFDAISWLESLNPNTIIRELWLDHDLGLTSEGETDTIMPFVLKLEEKAYFNEAPQINEIMVHTMNSTEVNRIIQALGRFFKTRAVETTRYLTAGE